MALFCLFWMPLFYILWRAVTGCNISAGGVWALLAGSIIALARFFLGALVVPGGFGLSRWVSACIDIVMLPALAPILVYFFLVCFRIISGTADFANFALLWLIPVAAMRALGWSSLNDPILLVLVPILWTAIAVGVPFFIGLIQNGRIYVIIPSFLAILVILFAAASSYWAFYVQRSSVGFAFLLAAVVPMLISLVLSLIKAGN
jgi:hypothetical protein